MNVLIVGAASSLGQPITRRLVDAGHRVLATSRQGTKRPENGATWADLDLTDPTSILSFTESTAAEFAPLGTLIMLAGVLPGRSLVDYEDADIEHVMTVNFTGPARLVRDALPLLDQQAHVILMSSVSGQQGSFDPIYAASKAALIGLTKSLATWLAPDVRVNALAPSLIEGSKMFVDMAPEVRSRHVARSATGRLRSLEEVADVIHRMTGPEWAERTGEVIGLGDETI